MVDVNKMYSLKLCYKDVSVITLPKACYIHVSFSKRDTLIQITQTKCDHEPVGRQGINLILNFLNSAVLTESFYILQETTLTFLTICLVY